MERIKELELLIKRYQDSYYSNEAEIEDSEFDKLWDELKTLDPTNLILKKIGSDVIDEQQITINGFDKIQHVMPMGSQEKAANPEAFLQWTQKINYDQYIVEYKLDGASLEMQYENGIFIKGITRGDGNIGDDITANVLQMKGLVKELTENFTGGIRGEVIMSHQVHEQFYSKKANCRNAANGLMKKKDGKGCEHLQIICYDAFPTDTVTYYTNEVEKVKWLKKQGFDISPLKICKTPQDVIDYRAHVMEIRKSIPYDIDGLVIKGFVIDLEDAKRNRPEKQIAFKFSLEEAISIVKKVEWSESGATYTPIAIFDTVDLAGTKVKRASLVNPNTIRNLGIGIGSHVVVTKRGEIIPKIEKVIKHSDVEIQTIVFPVECSVCHTKLIDEGTRLFCPNKNCSKRVHHQIEKWISIIDIRDFGEQLIKKLFEAKKITSISDIYKLNENDLTEFFLNEESILDKNESKGAKKVIASIKNHTEVSLQSFIAGFDIEGIGETLVDKLIEFGFNTIDKLINATEIDIANVPGFASVTAHTFCEGIKENLEEINFLLNNQIIKLKQVSEGKLSGMSFCFTGELVTMKRQDAEQIVKALGGSVKSSVTKDLSYLVTNDKTSGSSKNVKAASLNIPVIDEKEFLSISQINQ